MDILLRSDEGNWLYLAMDGREPLLAESGEVRIGADLAWQAKALGDLDGDGRDDLGLRDPDGGLFYYPMDGRFRQRGAGRSAVGAHRFRHVEGVGDLNADGRDDPVHWPTSPGLSCSR